jgi:site-specific recombinase XerD
MLEQVFTDHSTIQQHRNGPLGNYSDRLASHLISVGYCPADLTRRFGVISDLNRWLKKCSLALSDLSPDQVDAFCRYRRRKVRRFYRSGDHATLQMLLTILRKDGLIPPKLIASKWGAEIEQAVAPFRQYLAHEKGFSESALTKYVTSVSQLLRECFADQPLSLPMLTVADLSRFIRGRAQVWSPRSMQTAASAWRAFLRFAFANGHTPRDLSGSIPASPSWRGQRLPDFLAQRDVLKLLASCDKRTKKGLRDYAILLLMVRLGLRASEVLRLSLDDLNWREATLLIRGKGPRQAELPLPDDVGQALVAYLTSARPPAQRREVFLRSRAPFLALNHASSISTIVGRALAAAHLNPRRKGAHLLRYTAASESLRQGASLPEVGELLRHRSLDTTAIYAKVDLSRLTEIARPWPIAERRRRP